MFLGGWGFVCVFEEWFGGVWGFFGVFSKNLNSLGLFWAFSGAFSWLFLEPQTFGVFLGFFWCFLLVSFFATLF